MNAGLPLHRYFDPASLDHERRSLFATAPEYVGCLPMVPVPGAFATLSARDHCEVLVRDAQGPRLLSNVCLHRDMPILHGRGTARALTCPMHRWTYDLQGRLRGRAGAQDAPLRLPSRRLEAWNGILFAGDGDLLGDLACLGARPDLDVSRYVFVERHEELSPVNWKILMEVFLDVEHVASVHPGFYRFQHPGAPSDPAPAVHGRRLNYEEVAPHPDFGRNPASEAYARWQAAILRLTGGAVPRRAIAYLVRFPATFFEWYPFSFLAYTHVPQAVDATLVVTDFFHDPEALARLPELPQLVRAAWVETTEEDRRLQLGLQRARAERWRRTGRQGWASAAAVLDEAQMRFAAYLEGAEPCTTDE